MPVHGDAGRGLDRGGGRLGGAVVGRVGGGDAAVVLLGGLLDLAPGLVYRRSVGRCGGGGGGRGRDGAGGDGCVGVGDGEGSAGGAVVVGVGGVDRLVVLLGVALDGRPGLGEGGVGGGRHCMVWLCGSG